MTKGSEKFKPDASKNWCWTVLPIALYLGLLANWWFGPLRLTIPLFNYLIMVAVFGLPVVNLVSLLRAPRSLIKVILGTILAPLTGLSVLLGCLLLFWIVSLLPDGLLRGRDFSYEHIRSLQIGRAEIKIYRTDGGPTTHFGIVVREEHYLLPGLAWVRWLCAEYPADDVDIRVVGRSRICCSFPPYGRRPLREDCEIKVVTWP